MEVVYSDLILLGGRLDENIKALMAHGAQSIELMMDGGEWDNFPDGAAELLSTLRQYPVTYTLHSPCWDVNPTSENAFIRRASLDSCLAAVDFAKDLGAAHLVIHPGFCQAPGFDRQQASRRSREILGVLCERARSQGVHLAVENVGHGGTSLYTQEEYVHLLDGFGEEAAYLIDTGHAVLNGWDIPQMIRQTGHRLLGMHLHDNDGVCDSHLPIGSGVTQWEPICDAIMAAPHCDSLILEYNMGTPLEEMKRSMLWLENRLQMTTESSATKNIHKVKGR